MTSSKKKFRKIILKAANHHIGKKKVSPQNRCEMTTEIKEAIKKRNRLRKTVGRNREQWIKACQETATLVKNEKERRWKEYVESLDRKTDGREIWKTIRAIDGRCPPQNRN